MADLDLPDVALQKALVAQLRADTALAALVGARIYDEPPDHAALPYVRIGSIDLAPHHTDGVTGWSIMLGLECWSRPKAGRVEAARIAGAVRVALDRQPLSVAGHRHAWTAFTASATRRESDGKTYVATVAFDVVVEALPPVPPALGQG